MQYRWPSNDLTMAADDQCRGSHVSSDQLTLIKVFAVMTHNLMAGGLGMLGITHVMWGL